MNHLMFEKKLLILNMNHLMFERSVRECNLKSV